MARQGCSSSCDLPEFGPAGWGRGGGDCASPDELLRRLPRGASSRGAAVPSPLGVGRGGLRGTCRRAPPASPPEPEQRLRVPSPVQEHPGPLDERSTALVVLIRGNRIIVGNAGDCRCVFSRNGQEHPGPLDEGSTALVVLIRGNQIIVGNAGDCRCVLSRNGQAIALSTYHKPSVPDETQRIEKAGHFVTLCRGASRVDEGIVVSRSIGDMRYKNNIHLTPDLQLLTCSPEIPLENITDDAEFLIMACDGIWDVVQNQGLVGCVHDNMKDGLDLAANCENILDMCVGPPKPSYDNMAIILVRFKHAAPAPTDRQHDRQEHAITDEVLDTKRNAPLEVEPGTSAPSCESAHF